MPQLVQKDGRWALMVDGAPYLILATQVNNSSAWPGMLPEVWPAVDRLHANTVEAPVYWEQLEPVQGQVRFLAWWMRCWPGRASTRCIWCCCGLGHGRTARRTMPEWVKRDQAKYPRLMGPNGEVRDTMSPFGAATLAADKAAFSALMRHLKAADPRHTVLMVQVENEINAYGSARDYSPEATRLFEGPVPAEFAAAMHM